MRRASWVLALVLCACGGETSARDAGGDPRDAGDGSARDASEPPGTDAGGEAPDAGPARVTVAVAHDRELRGAWVASVFNITWPSRAGLTEAESRAEITTILDVMAELRMNAVFLQIRPESDALYASSLEPWSRALTGTQGGDPGWDPLSVWLDEAHARGVEVHAWMNPYRGMASQSAPTAANHVTQTLSQHAHDWSTSIWMDPGAPEVRAHVVAVVRDVVRRYAIDGVHFDDYFYPYPEPAPSTRDFPDDATYAAYGGGMDRDAWRRQNVNTMVREVSEAIAAERDDVRFGVSPFGIHRPGEPEGISGLDAYAVLHTDAPHWIAEGWVDYLAPQLYWPSTQTAQAFEPLLGWWSALPRDADRSILAGLNLAKLGDGDAWSLAEFRTQVQLTRAARSQGARGVILYTVEPLVEDRLGVRALFRDELFTTPAAAPPMAGAGDPPDAPDVELSGTTVTVASENVRYVAVYAAGEASFTLDRLVPASAAPIPLASGRWAISVIDRRGRESAGVPVDVP